MHLSPLRLLKFKRGSVFDVDFAMVSIGQIVYACCKDKNQQICKLGGWVVEADESSVVIATNPKLVKHLPSVSTAQISSDQPRVAFVRLPGSSVVDVLPAGWAGPDSKSLPPLEPCKQTWNVAKSKDLRSSDAEAPAPMVPPSGLTQELAQMQALFGQAGGDSDDSSDDDLDLEDLGNKARSSTYLAPGAGIAGMETKKEKKKKDPGFQQLLSSAMASGQNPSELMPMMMMMYMMEQSKGRKHRDRSSHTLRGGSSSESSDDDLDRAKESGLKAVSALHKMHDRIKKHPSKIIKEFEAEIIQELGIMPGQPWSIRDYIKKQNWGKYKGLFRTAIQDAAAYELLRSGHVQAGMAQLVQNIKSKHQAILQGGDWTTAWLLTGIPDPLIKREFGGSRQELAVVSGYIDALHKLRKRVKEAQTTAGQEDEDEDGAKKK